MRHALRTAGVGAVAALALTALATPSIAMAAPDETGGAIRHDDYANATQLLLDSIETGPAKNVILLIGDGMGDSEITIARNYAYGAAGELPGIDALPLTGAYTTYSLYRDGTPNAGKPDYVPDSAATGTAWATGTKTYDNAVGVDIHGTAHDNLIEIAKANGLRTGNVSTAEIQDATPAVQAAHVASRTCYGPDTDAIRAAATPPLAPVCGSDLLENGGLGSISEQLLDTRADVTLGGGSASFDQTANAGPWSGETLVDQAADRGFQYVTDAAGLNAVTAAGQDAPLLGLFTPGNFPTRYTATPATVGGADLAPVACTPNPSRLDTDLDLESLTTKAISLLDDPASPEGFFLQVEGASIDKQDHAADACGQIGETVDLDEAVQAALDFAIADGNTMVIVTADHSHSSQIVDSTPPATLSIALSTTEGSVMKVAYGTAAAGGSQQHTGSQLRIAGYGPGAANIVGLTDQTDNFFTISSALELNRDVVALSAGGSATISDAALEPGEAFTIAASGFAGDRQLTSTSTGEPVDPEKADLVYGDTELSGVAPTALGDYTVTLVGNRTGKSVTVDFSVTADGEPAAVPGGPAGNPVGGGTTGGSSMNPLASTGLAIAPYLGLGVLLLGAGAAVIIARRRRHHA
ncbi:alkaline phosphatase [Amnibacterium flavum]|uniref:Alkaline phosphatase n=1 Tax=Amnibacterium flavum TaxID=2173173 RepID=A0A2V1HWW0_9MICO|nr:alkaline phosphatase [Amnibacterium flavum]PVZ95037.1 alkaline phosphatase [Amnibacterium flavum]